MEANIYQMNEYLFSRQGRASVHIYPNLYLGPKRRPKAKKAEKPNLSNVGKLIQQLEAERIQEQEQEKQAQKEENSSVFKSQTREERNYTYRNRTNSPPPTQYSPNQMVLRPRTSNGPKYRNSITKPKRKKILLASCLNSKLTCTYFSPEKSQRVGEVEYVDEYQEKLKEKTKAWTPIPEKMSMQVKSPRKFSIQKSRDPFIKICQDSHEERFNFLPPQSLVLSKNKRTVSVDFNNYNARKQLFPPRESLDFYPKQQEHLMPRLNTHILPFSQHPSKDPRQNRPQIQSPDLQLYEKAFNKQAYLKGAKKIPKIDSLVPRDDSMYRTIPEYVQNVPLKQHLMSRPQYHPKPFFFQPRAQTAFKQSRYSQIMQETFQQQMLKVAKSKNKIIPLPTEADQVTQLEAKRRDSVIRKLASMANDDQSVLNNQEHLDQKMRTQPEFWNIRCIIFPDDSFRIFWDFMVVLLMVYTLVVSPFRVAFIVQNIYEWLILDFIVNGIFFVDILINCFSAYQQQEGIFVVDHKQIVWHYFKTWMLFDLAACIPFQLVSDTQTDWGAIIRLGRVPRAYQQLKQSRLFKLSRCKKKFQKQYCQCCSTIQNNIQNLLVFSCVFLVLCHMMACRWYQLVANYPLERQNWVRHYGIQDQNLFDIYVASFYWVITTMTTIGYGDITPRNNLERGMCILVMIAGVFIYSYIIGSITSMMADNEQKTSKLYQKINILNEITQNFNIGKRLYKKTKTALEQDHQRVAKQRSMFIEKLPVEIGNQLNLIVQSDVIQNNLFFRGKSLMFIMTLIKYLRPMKIKANENIYKKGQFSDEFFMIKQGEVGFYAIYSNFQLTYQRLYQNEYFGQIQIFLSESRQTSIKGVKHTQLITILKNDLLGKVLKYFQQIKVNMIVEAHQKYEKLLEKKDQAIYLYKHQQGILSDVSVRESQVKSFTAMVRKEQSSYFNLRGTLAPTTRAFLDQPERQTSIENLKDDIADLRKSIRNMEARLRSKDIVVSEEKLDKLTQK